MYFPLNTSLQEREKEFIKTSIERSSRAREIRVTDDGISVTFDEEVSQKSFEELVKRLLFVAKSIDHEVIFENRKERPYSENPMQYLEESRDVIRVANGMYVLQGIFWKLVQFFDDYWRDCARAHGAIEQEYPALWPIDLYRKINFFHEFPQEVLLATGVKDNYKDRDMFAEQYAKEHDYLEVQVKSQMDPSRFGLQSAICDICYYVLEGQTDFTNTVYTSKNRVFRNESSKTNSLDRLTSYSMREIIFVGDQEYVLAKRQDMINECIEFLQFLDLDGAIKTANDPFFTNESTIKNIFQNAERLKYELLARLYFSGTDLAVGSINLHLDFFGRSFNIRLPNGSYVHSGCIGIGFERLVYALYCQYGHELGSWPTELQKKLGISYAAGES